jgi:hypothetical protein
MALIVKDRVQETSSTTGTGTFTLDGALSGFETFSSAIGNTNTTYYCIVNANGEFEVGLGTVGAGTLARDTILSSSNSDAAVNFSAGTKNVFCTQPAGKALYTDASGNAIALGTVASATLTNATGLPIATGVSGLGTNVATFLATPSSANLASAVTNETGSGSLVFGTSPTLVTPILGTPTSATLTNATGLPIVAGTTGTLSVARGGTGITSLGANVATFLGTPSSANLAAAVTNETGSGSLVFGTSPTLTTPRITNAGFIADNNGNEQIKFVTTASAVNEISVTNAATGNGPEISATGSNTDIDLKLTPKGAGKLNLDGIKFPNADGTANQFLKTNGSGVLSFASAGLSWQSVQTTGFTAVKGNAYPCDTTSAGFTVTLPATPSAGDQVQLVDYAGTFDSNILEINPNGEDIEGGTDNLALTGEREGVILTYIDSTQGWIATSGINEGTKALGTIYSVDYLVVGGGGAGAPANTWLVGAGGGAGGYLTGTVNLTQTVTYTIIIGAGGAGSSSIGTGASGANSVLSGTGITTVTSIGGGGGGHPSATTGGSGGSGGGAGGSGAVGSGTVGQGNNGGTSTSTTPNYGQGGGGGAGAVGGNGTTTAGGAGGAGTASSITGSSVTRAGGGGGGTFQGGTRGTGGSGGGGNAGNNPAGNGFGGTINSGGGGGGASSNGGIQSGGSGGSGIIILSVPTINYSGTTTGSPTVTTSGSNTILQFTASGSYTG